MFAVCTANLTANMCKNPADLLQSDIYCIQNVMHVCLLRNCCVMFGPTLNGTANMCKNPADIQDPGYCIPSVSNEIQKKMPYGKTWENITCAELCSTAGAAALNNLQGYPQCCGGNAKLRCLNENKTCSDETGTIIPNGSSATTMYLCKKDADFRSDGLEQAAKDMGVERDPGDTSTCSTRNGAMLVRFNHASWQSITCDMVAEKKEAFYEHVSFGTACCGARDKVRCLDSSTSSL